MTSLLSAQRRVAEFAAAVDGGHGGQAMPQPAELRSDRRSAQLGELLALVTALREQPSPVPRPAYVANLREQLLAEARSAPAPTPSSAPTRPAPAIRRTGSRERRLAAVAAALVAVGGTSGVATAAQSALPGETLYPVKRGLENVEVGVSFGDAGKGRDFLEAASSRLEEAGGLIAGGDDGVTWVEPTISDFDDQATAGTDLLLRAFEEDRNPSTVAEVRTFTASSMETLQTLAAEAPATARDDLSAAAQTVERIDHHAWEMCNNCAPDAQALSVPAELSTSGASSQTDPGSEPSGSDPDLPGGVVPDPGSPGAIGTTPDAMTDVPGTQVSPGTDPGVTPPPPLDEPSTTDADPGTDPDADPTTDPSTEPNEQPTEQPTSQTPTDEASPTDVPTPQDSAPPSEPSVADPSVGSTEGPLDGGEDGATDGVTEGDTGTDDAGVDNSTDGARDDVSDEASSGLEGNSVIDGSSTDSNGTDSTDAGDGAPVAADGP